MRRHRFTIAALLACAPFAHALQRVNLRNGFSYDCVRQEPIDATHVRLFLADSGSIDLPLSAIASVEAVPDASLLTTPDPLAKAATQASSTQTGLRGFMDHAGARHHIDVELLASIANTESAGNTHAVSHKGARGVMQLMPSTARQLGVLDSLEPEGNINGGAAYLDQLLTRYKDNLALALAAYNAGPGAVDHYRGIPPFRETRAYVLRVMNEFKRRKDALAAGAQLASR